MDDREVSGDKAGQVREMFARIVPRYDLMNTLMTGGRDQAWRRLAVKAVGAGPGRLALDVATGTGELALALARAGCHTVGLDFARWHRESALLDICITAPPGATWRQGYVSALDRRMRAVCEELAGDGAVSDGTSLSKLYSEQYALLRSQDPFQIYSQKVLNQFLPESSLDGESKGWKQSLGDLLQRVGPLIWEGDKLPMAANHSAQHRHDLLRIAQMLLTPIADAQVPSRNSESEADNGKYFLNNAERIVLLAAILLHDCGHVLDRLPWGDGEVVLCRSEIRSLHHYLAYRRLDDRLLQNTLDWRPPANDGIWERILHLCYYHRRSTGWNEADDKLVGYSTKSFPDAQRFREQGMAGGGVREVGRAHTAHRWLRYSGGQNQWGQGFRDHPTADGI